MPNAFRITERAISTRVLTGLNGNLNRLGNLQQQLSSGKLISKPSDSPTGTVVAMQYRSEIATAQQYSRNADDGLGWLNTADGALTSIVTQVQRARELVLQGMSNGAAGSQEARESLATEVDSLHKSVIAAANRRFLDRPVFGGNTSSPTAYDDDGNYTGDDGGVMRTVGDSNRVKVDTPGLEVFGDGDTQIFTVLADVADDLRNNPDNLRADLDRIDAASVRLTTGQSSVGARVNQVTQMKQAAEDRVLDLTGQLSGVEDIDLAKTITDMQLQQNAYQVALSAAAKVIQPSLVDFLR
jgi:flagellar hook-associated protein 3 FlgL